MSNNYFQNFQNELGYSNYDMLMMFVMDDASGDDMDFVLGEEWFEEYYDVRESYMKDLYNSLSNSDKVKLEKDSKREYCFENGFAAYYQL